MSPQPSATQASRPPGARRHPSACATTSMRDVACEAARGRGRSDGGRWAVGAGDRGGGEGAAERGRAAGAKQTCSFESGAKRKRVQRDWSAGMIFDA